MYGFSDRIKNLSGSATREILKLTQRPEIISFAGGMPAAECLPCDIVKDIANDILGGANAPKILQYGRTEGCDELNEMLVGYLSKHGISTDTDGIQVVSGGQQGLDLMCKAFLNVGDTVLVENPTYLAFLQIAKTYEANIIGVDADANGLVLADLEDKLEKYRPKLLYTVPTFSNPTGKTYTTENRKAIVELCEKFGTVVIEDDPYGRLRYGGDEVPLMKTMDARGTVVYITSFSKTVAPSLRVAVACGDKEIIRKLTIGKQGADVHNPALTQTIVAEYLKRGYFEPVLERNIKVYRERRDAMLAALDKYMPNEIVYTRPNGGLFVWVTLPAYIDAKAMLPEAIERNVAYIQGEEFFPKSGDGKNTMRLNFSNSSPERIDKGISILAELIKQKMRKHKENTL